MDVFAEYKQIRNKIALLASDDALSVIWAYCQFLQTPNFHFPPEVEVSKDFLENDFPQRWISEWELELLAKEVILNGKSVASKGRTLRKWKNMSELINAIKAFENKIYGCFGSPESVLVELVRIAHRQFIWQANPPNSTTTIRYFKIFNRPVIDAICLDRIGLTVSQLYMCGTALMGFFLEHPAITVPFKSEIKALPIDTVEKFLSFTCRPWSELRKQLKDKQEYDANFAYTNNSLRAYPLVKMSYQGNDAIVCPLMTLLFWRFTGGLYYELIGDPRFANEFGDGFQTYVGEVIKRAWPDPKKQRIAEQEYFVRKKKKRMVDWIIVDEHSALFIECKAKRLSWGAKASLADLGPLEADIDSMASSVVQVYKTVTDYLNNHYPNFAAKEGRKIFPAVVTLENWRMFGPVMLGKLADAVASKLTEVGLAPELTVTMPYSIWAIEELEVGVQIMNVIPIADFMEGKLKTEELRQWDWHGYMIKHYPKSFPAKKLFEKEYDEMFSELHAAQST
jgi:hypothetical protein